ncbi:MAG: type II secretion system protein [Candidatus Kuenenbacteria bacterium]
MKNKTGFTLIELLVVIAIFALIASVTMVSLGNARKESRDVQRMSDINQMRSALHLYSLENPGYPSGDNIPLGTGSYLILNANGWTADTTPPIFMYSVPRDPKMINKDTNVCTNSSTDVCDYGFSVNGNDFIIYFYLEGTVGNMAGGLHAATKDEII